MQFHVPQFIEVEDKIFGPLSAKQFFYIGGAVGSFALAFAITKSIFFGLIFSSPVIALGFALAFYQVNNRSFIYIVEAAFKYATGGRLYVWKKIPKKVTPKSGKHEDEETEELFVPKLSDSKLKDLAWSLDIQETVYSNQNQ